MSGGAIRRLEAKRFREGRWRNGLGTSWEIAEEPSARLACGFRWRFATALISQNVPFSTYPEVDRIFTLIEGNGLTLDIGGRTIDVASPFVPCRFPGDTPTTCHLTDGPCRALNLFLARGQADADVRLLHDRGKLSAAGNILGFALSGRPRLGELQLETGDAAIGFGLQGYDSQGGVLYAALLTGP
jgi:environmental stress-induced protein Ves